MLLNGHRVFILDLRQNTSSACLCTDNADYLDVVVFTTVSNVDCSCYSRHWRQRRVEVDAMWCCCYRMPAVWSTVLVLVDVSASRWVHDWNRVASTVLPGQLGQPYSVIQRSRILRPGSKLATTNSTVVRTPQFAARFQYWIVNSYTPENSHATSVTFVISCTVSEIRQLIGWKLQISPTPLSFGSPLPVVFGISRWS